MICNSSQLFTCFLLLIQAFASSVRADNSTTDENDLNSFSPQPTIRRFQNEESLEIILKASPEYNTIEELVDDLETWEAPEEMKLNYPYYLSGYDDEERPIWIGEIGKWDVRKIGEAGGEMLEMFDKYMRQMFYRSLRSLDKKDPEDDTELELVFIGDMDQLELRQITHVPTVSLGLKQLRILAPLFNKHTATGYFINTNYVAGRLLDLVRPILGGFFEKIHVFGNNQAKWIPHLLRRLPKDQIPEWYGGSKNFKPVAIYG